MNRRQVIGVLLLGALVACDRSPQEAGPSPNRSNVAPGAVRSVMALTLPDLAGQPQAMAQWQGKILVINYWATWCAPCRVEMPAFSHLHDKYAANGVQFVGISIDSADKVANFQKETPISYPLLIGTMNTMQTAVDLGNSNQGLPYTAIIDRGGNLVATKLGRLSEEKLDEQIRALIKP